MAMTKAEKAYMENLERDLSFRWPTVPEPERMPLPSNGADVVDGWDFNTHTGFVEQCWSTSINHGSWYNGERMKHGRRDGQRLYATRADALIALRWALCREFARKLRDVDVRLATGP